MNRCTPKRWVAAIVAYLTVTLLSFSNLQAQNCVRHEETFVNSMQQNLVDCSFEIEVFFTVLINGTKEVTVELAWPGGSETATYLPTSGAIIGVGTYSIIFNVTMPCNTTEVNVTVTGYTGNGSGSLCGSQSPIIVILPPLPVELTSFGAEKKGRTNSITWTTATEKNTDWHILERSANGENNFTEVARVRGAGESSASKRYHIEDKTPLSMNYYRLRIVDKDGSEQLSKIIVVRNSKTALSNIRINNTVTTPYMVINVDAEKNEDVNFSFIDMAGRRLVNENKILSSGSNTIQIQTGDLPAGIYLLSLRTETENQVFKILQK